MTTCHSCGAAEDGKQEPPPTRRRHYVCGSYSTDNHTTRQSDLCFANQRIRNVPRHHGRERGAATRQSDLR